MAEDEKITEACRLLEEAKNVVVFTGAGISAESGIPTFRGKDGMWEKYRAEDLATPYAFENDPKKVWEWYDWRRQKIQEGGPNPAHLTIAKMEKNFPNFSVITQNVDGLHRKAGSKNIIELHGNIWRVRCLEEQKIFEFLEVPLSEIPPKCKCGSLIRPDVVWFGEAMPQKEISQAFLLSEECDSMLVVGTSVLVQPAASLPFSAKTNGASIIEINLAATPVSSIANVSIFGKAGEILPEIFQRLEQCLSDGM
ncbi:MAG: NAD-dependent deacylase [Thermoplasmata archaeon]|nr:MAG: NAD-dependent deacylase [Thermoplasmata archaeon]